MSGGDSVVYRTCPPIADARFDPVDGPPLSEALVDAIASAADANPTELPPLYQVVDLDALDTLFTPERAQAGGIFSFSYQGYHVFISAGGRIRVCDRSQQTEPTPVFDGPTRQ